MRALPHKIKTFQKEFSLLPGYAFSMRIFWLVALLAALIIGSLIFNAINTIVFKSHTYSHLPYVSLGFEFFVLIPSFLQVICEIDQQRCRRLYPQVRPAGFRAAVTMINRAKYERIEVLFGPQESLEKLAKGLIEEWKWRREIQLNAGETDVQKAQKFFRLPSGSNLATYLAGVLAIVAGIVIALIDKDSFYQNLPTLWDSFEVWYAALFKVIVMPIAICIIPLAAIWSSIKALCRILAENMDDDFLSQPKFYSFIKELLELADRKERRLLLKTTGRAYWSIRLLTAPIHEIPGIYRNIRRSKRLAKLRKAHRSKGLPA